MEHWYGCRAGFGEYPNAFWAFAGHLCLLGQVTSCLGQSGEESTRSGIEAHFRLAQFSKPFHFMGETTLPAVMKPWFTYEMKLLKI